MSALRSITFVVLIIVCTGVQALIWHANDYFTDEKVWGDRTENLAEDLQHPFALSIERYSGHPGMTVLIPAALLHIGGQPLGESLRWSIAFVNGVAIAGIFAVAQKLKPHSVWWLAAGIITLVHPLHLQVSPTNTVMATLSVLIVFLTWHIYEKSNRPAYYLVLLGIALGAGLATRFIFAGALCLAVGILLLPYIKQKIASLAAVSLVAFFVFDPLLWSNPTQHILHMLGRANTHFNAVDVTLLRYSDLILYTPFTLLSLLVWFSFLIPRFSSLQPLPRSIGWFVLIFTAAITAIYLNADGQSLRYFFPLILVWESLLPLFLIPLASRISLPVSDKYAHKIQRMFPSALALSVAGAQVFLLLYALHLPFQREILDWHDISPRLRPHSQQTIEEMVK